MAVVSTKPLKVPLLEMRHPKKERGVLSRGYASTGRGSTCERQAPAPRAGALERQRLGRDLRGGGCGSGGSGHLVTIGNAQLTKAKRPFLAVWFSIARGFGLQGFWALRNPNPPTLIGFPTLGLSLAKAPKGDLLLFLGPLGD